MSLKRPAAGGESCFARFFFIRKRIDNNNGMIVYNYTGRRGYKIWINFRKIFYSAQIYYNVFAKKKGSDKMNTIFINPNTNLLEEDNYSYELQDVETPQLFRDVFPYTEVPALCIITGMYL